MAQSTSQKLRRNGWYDMKIASQLVAHLHQTLEWTKLPNSKYANITQTYQIKAVIATNHLKKC